MSRFGVCLLLFIILSCSSVSAELISLPSFGNATIKENTNWIYFDIHSWDGAHHFGLSKVEGGRVGIGLNNEFIGDIYGVPAFKHPVNNFWYVCPLKDLPSLNVYSTDHDIILESDGDVTCYQNSDRSQSIVVPMTSKINLSYDGQGIKINNNVTVNTALSPTDTGFGYFIIPTDQDGFRYVGNLQDYIDMTDPDQALPVIRRLVFYNSDLHYIRQSFDWSDMIETGNFYSEIATMGGNHGLFIGTYGYGASKNILVDPYYYVDLEPSPATEMTGAPNSSSPDEDFTTSGDVTTTLTDGMTSTYIYIQDFGTVSVLRLAWDYTYESGKTVFLRFYDSNGGTQTIKTYAYHNSTDINTSKYKSYISTGTGFHSVNITDLIKYQDNLGFNYTLLRMTDGTGSSIPIAEAMLRVETNDTTPPEITNCSVSANNFSCGETVNFSCTVTDNLEVAYVSYYIDGNHYLASKDNNTYYVEIQNNLSGMKNYAWTEASACDIFNLCDDINPSLSVFYDCEGVCEENWIFIGSECYDNSSQYFEYLDSADCNTTYELPATNGTWQSCYYYLHDFNCSISPVPYLSRKMDYICFLPYNDSEWSCANTISYGFDDVLQVNPEKSEKATALVTLSSNVESREHFLTSNGILNAYYTDKNLAVDTPFLLTTSCRNGAVTLTNQAVVIPSTKDFNEGITAWIWIRNNAPILIGVLILVFVVAFMVGALIKELKGR